MLAITNPGIYIDENLLMNYKRYNLSSEEFMFLLQVKYITEKYQNNFSISLLSEQLKESEKIISAKIEVLAKKHIVSVKENKLTILLEQRINNEKNNSRYTIKELVKVVESIVARTLTSKEVDIIYSWVEKGFTKTEIDEAFSISRNINYVNGILNNKVVNDVEKNNLESDDILGYDWLNK